MNYMIGVSLLCRNSLIFELGLELELGENVHRPGEKGRVSYKNRGMIGAKILLNKINVDLTK